MTLNEECAKLTFKQLLEAWGGALPSHEEFIAASKVDKVQVDKTIATKAVYQRLCPISYYIIYGLLTLWAGIIILPATVIYYLLSSIGFDWIIYSFLLSWFLIHVSREGHCLAIRVAAEKDSSIYEILVKSGAFLFFPNNKIK